MLAAAPYTADVFALSANPMARAKRLIGGSGSVLSDAGYEYYARLISDRTHVDGALQMMAQWDLTPLLRHLEDVQSECHFITGAKDSAVPAGTATKAAAHLPHAQVTNLEGLGHLLHEEAPEQALGLIRDCIAV